MGCSVGMACTHKLRKLTWIQTMFTWSCVFEPQSYDVFKWTYKTISMWQIQKTRIWLTDWVSLGIPSTLQKRRITSYNLIWSWCSCIKDNIKSATSIGNMTSYNLIWSWCVLALKTLLKQLHLLETCYKGLQSISTYCCSCQSLDHNTSRSRIYYWTFTKMMIICTDWIAFSTFYSKAISLQQNTLLMTQNARLLLAKQISWCVWMVLRIHT